MKKKLLVLLVATFVALTSLQAGATPISVNQWYGFGFAGATSPLTDGSGFVLPTNPAGIAAPATPWTFTLANPGTLTVLDLFDSVDRFELFDFGASLGLTSVPTGGGACGSDITCALADLDYSRGIFNLAAGLHSITGTQVAGVPGAGAFRVSARTTAVPAPSSILLFVLGLGLVAGVRLRRRN